MPVPRSPSSWAYTPEELLGQQFLLLRTPEMAARFIREIEMEPNPESGFFSWHYSHTHKDGRELNNHLFEAGGFAFAD